MTILNDENAVGIFGRYGLQIYNRYIFILIIEMPDGKEYQVKVPIKNVERHLQFDRDRIQLELVGVLKNNTEIPVIPLRIYVKDIKKKILISVNKLEGNVIETGTSWQFNYYMYLGF